jgi:membrane-associated HD superfamily phosphohydrolase
MVKAVLRVAWLAAVVLLPVSNLSAKALADYQVGDKIEEDIVATSKISVVDPDGTQALKEKEAMRQPVVVRYYTNAADNLEARFRQDFVQTRENFLEALDKTFGHRTLTAEELSSSRFDSLRTLFQKQNNLFPLGTNRAALWATADADEGYEASLASTLRQMMSTPIRPEPASETFKIGATVRLMPVSKASDLITEEEVRPSTHSFPRTNFVTFATVKKNLQSYFSPDEREVGKYLATLLKPNCEVDEEITRKLRDKRTEGMSSAVDFEAGQIIAHRGQVVDKKIKAAIDQIKEKAVVGQLQELQAKQQAAVGELQQLVAANKAKGAHSQERVIWLIGALAAVVLILAVATWQLARRRQPVTMLPATVGGNAADWQERALVAEQRTEKLQNAARAGLIAHLSQWFSRLLTQRLISQRRMLLETHDNAAAEMAALEARLEKVQAPLQVRLAAYEHRIAELEKELAVRGEENRELLKAKIETMRKQLEAERGKNRVSFN